MKSDECKPKNATEIRGVNIPETGVNIKRNGGSTWSGIYTQVAISLAVYFFSGLAFK
jgi:MFS superfamily sulfate permease-like transporter